MAGREFRMGRIPNGDAPNIQSQQIVAAQTFKKGAVLIFNTNKLQEAAATPTTGIVGIALQAAFTNPGNQLPYTSSLAAGSPIGGRPNDASFLVADRVTVFSGRMVNGGTDPVTPAQTDVGAQYGLIKTADGTWAVNQADTANKAVTVVEIEPQTYAAAPPVVYFKFMSAAIGNASN